ncbi:MAG: helix-turn-helix transcriptional regulator [Myxococcales bacterium]|nr:helix-turn-helix transcriptional regulator [Myxococcales bacterium]
MTTVLLAEGGGVHVAALARTSRHAHHAAKLLIPLDGFVDVGPHERALERTRAPFWVVPDEPNVAGCEGPCVTFFFDPRAADGRLLASLPRSGPIEGRVAEDLRAIARGGLDTLARDARDVQRELSRRLVDDQASRRREDRRVRVMRERLDGDPSFELAELARAVGLSPWHASRVFAEVTGLPPKTYALWRKLLAAYAAQSEGASIATAASLAGFADQAHYTRTARRFMGQPPSYFHRADGVVLLR